MTTSSRWRGSWPGGADRPRGPRRPDAGRLLFLAAILLVAGLDPGPGPGAMAARPVKIAVLTEAWGPNPQTLGLRDGLKEMGYREDDNFVIGVRSTQGDVLALPGAARELVQQGVDLIVPGGGAALEAARAATSSLPIVFVGGGYPVERGVVQSIARPGGNITGVFDLGFELAPKRLELLREIVPGLKRVFLAYAVNNEVSVIEARIYREAASRLGIGLVERPVRSQEEARAAFAALKKGDVQGLLVPYSMTWNVSGFTRETAGRLRLPAMWPSSFYVQQGGLASYGPDYYATGHQAARLVDKIVKGAKPGDIPIESNPRIDLAINVKTAEALGLRISPAIQARADRVIR